MVLKGQKMPEFLPDPSGAGQHLAFQFSYVWSDGPTDKPAFVSLDQILVPIHSLRDKRTKGQRDKGTKGQRDKGIKGQRDKWT